MVTIPYQIEYPNTTQNKFIVVIVRFLLCIYIKYQMIYNRNQNGKKKKRQNHLEYLKITEKIQTQHIATMNHALKLLEICFFVFLFSDSFIHCVTSNDMIKINCDERQPEICRIEIVWSMDIGIGHSKHHSKPSIIMQKTNALLIEQSFKDYKNFF